MRICHVNVVKGVVVALSVRVENAVCRVSVVGVDHREVVLSAKHLALSTFGKSAQNHIIKYFWQKCAKPYY
jgi:hypothetical protein